MVGPACSGSGAAGIGIISISRFMDGFTFDIARCLHIAEHTKGRTEIPYMHHRQRSSTKRLARPVPVLGPSETDSRGKGPDALWCYCALRAPALSFAVISVFFSDVRSNLEKKLRKQ